MKNTLVKNILYGAGVILLFIVISYAFVPEVLGGKIVNQSDISGWTGMTNEVITYNEDHPEDPSFWTNSMFGGMPTISNSKETGQPGCTISCSQVPDLRPISS